ncbi:MAG: hypothetical protein AB7N70_34495 [Dehalococcoidia bacterium]
MAVGSGQWAVGQPRRVVFGGMPYFGRRLAGLLVGDGWQARYLETRGWGAWAAVAAMQPARTADLVCMVGGQIGRLSRPHLLALALRRPLAMLWAGSDVLYARRVTAAGRVAGVLVRGVSHWAGAPWLAEELKLLGVDARWLPHSWVDAPATLPPLPAPGAAPFTVLTYLPEQRAAFYGGATVLHLARALPDVQVLVTGAASLPWDLPANVRCLGWVDEMAPVYAQSHVLLRLPRHDGLSFMVQEALAFGRYAVWNYPFQGAIQAGNGDAAIAGIRDLARRHAEGYLPLNEAGATYVRERFSAGRIRADLRAAMIGAMER